MTSSERSEKREEKRYHENGSQNFEDRSAKGALRNEQQVLRRDGRKQREERREKREESKWPPARFTAFLHGPRRAGWCRKGSGPRRENGRAQRKTRRERQSQSR